MLKKFTLIEQVGFLWDQMVPLHNVLLSRHNVCWLKILRISKICPLLYDQLWFYNQVEPSKGILQEKHLLHLQSVIIKLPRFGQAFCFSDWNFLAIWFTQSEFNISVIQTLAFRDPDFLGIFGILRSPSQPGKYWFISKSRPYFGLNSNISHPWIERRWFKPCPTLILLRIRFPTTRVAVWNTLKRSQIKKVFL